MNLNHDWKRELCFKIYKKQTEAQLAFCRSGDFDLENDVIKNEWSVCENVASVSDEDVSNFNTHRLTTQGQISKNTSISSGRDRSQILLEESDGHCVSAARQYSTPANSECSFCFCSPCVTASPYQVHFTSTRFCSASAEHISLHYHCMLPGQQMYMVLVLRGISTSVP